MDSKKVKFWLICIVLVINTIPAAAIIRPTDKEITLWIDEALKTDYRIDKSNIKVTSDSGSTV